MSTMLTKPSKPRKPATFVSVSSFLAKPKVQNAVSSQTFKSSVLKLIGTVVIPATTEPFMAMERCAITVGEKAMLVSNTGIGIYISGWECWFQKWFADERNPKIEPPISKHTLCHAKLRKPLKDRQIIRELGAKANIESFLAGVLYLMLLQGKGQRGLLLVNGKSNLFYIRDGRGGLCSFRVAWHKGGWILSANPTNHPGQWSIGDQIFWRKPVSRLSALVLAGRN